MFNHIRELHHSQTAPRDSINPPGFNHIRELHHSQTDGQVFEEFN